MILQNGPSKSPMGVVHSLIEPTTSVQICVRLVVIVNLVQLQFFISDILFPLPDGWPKIPEIFARRSWNFTNSTSPAINKATAHLELLQNVIEEWASEVKSEILSRASSRAAELSKSRSHSAQSQGQTASGKCCDNHVISNSGSVN